MVCAYLGCGALISLRYARTFGSEVIQRWKRAYMLRTLVTFLAMALLVARNLLVKERLLAFTFAFGMQENKANRIRSKRRRLILEEQTSKQKQ